MIPVPFKEQTTVFRNPLTNRGKRKTIPIHVSVENRGYISKWRLSFKEKLGLIFGRGYIWLVVYGTAHPPVHLVCTKTVFTKKENENEE